MKQQPPRRLLNALGCIDCDLSNLLENQTHTQGRSRGFEGVQTNLLFGWNKKIFVFILLENEPDCSHYVGGNHKQLGTVIAADIGTHICII